MSRIPSLALLFISAITLFQLPAVADTYQTLLLGSDAEVFLYGIDDSKVVLVNPPGFYCGLTAVTPCYITFVNGVDVSRTLIPPILSPTMNGSMGPGCAPLPANAVVSSYLCVNGYEAYAGEFPVPGQVRGITGIFNGPDPLANRVEGGIPEPGQNFIAENSFGDIVFDDSQNEYIIEEVDLTSRGIPEPGSMLLVGTGIAAAISMRRRLFR
jgi:PEP-CTERM motif